jgi:hypothetical protein
LHSKEFSGLTSDEAKVKISLWLQDNGIGGEEIVENRLHTINFSSQESRNAIKNKTKTIETRALNPEEPEKYFGDVKTGDVLKMVNKDTGEILYAKITEKYQRNNLEALFKAPELKDIYTRPYDELTNLEQLKDYYSFTNDYVEKIKKN